jgi:hypothetical protein
MKRLVNTVVGIGLTILAACGGSSGGPDVDSGLDGDLPGRGGVLVPDGGTLPGVDAPVANPLDGGLVVDGAPVADGGLVDATTSVTTRSSTGTSTAGTTATPVSTDVSTGTVLETAVASSIATETSVGTETAGISTTSVATATESGSTRILTSIRTNLNTTIKTGLLTGIKTGIKTTFLTSIKTNFFTGIRSGLLTNVVITPTVTTSAISTSLLPVLTSTARTASTGL